MKVTRRCVGITYNILEIKQQEYLLLIEGLVALNDSLLDGSNKKLTKTLKEHLRNQLVNESDNS